MSTKNLDLSFIIIGGGMSGILSAIKLKEAGYHNIRLYEKGDSFGGTWRENTYPGLTCDVPSHAYTYSFESNADWSHRYPPGDEIYAYFEKTASKYGIDKITQFNQEIQSCNFIEGQWHIETKTGTQDQADIVIAATGVLHVPNYPDIEGIDDFEGDIFHSARWDHRAALDGRRVAVIGSGSTGCQIISALSSRAAKLSHIQRTAQWIMRVEDYEFTEEQKAQFHQDSELLEKMRMGNPDGSFNLVGFTDAIIDPNSDTMATIEAILLKNLQDSVKDPELYQKLLPNYRAACKRLIFSPDYYHAIQTKNTELVTESIERIETKGIRTKDGVLHEYDVIALATGFKADRFMRPMQINGRNGVSLEQAWAKRPAAYLAITMPNFPNFYMLNGPNGPVGNFSLIEVAEAQWNYISQLIDQVAKGRCQHVVVKQQTLDKFDRERIAAAKNTIWATGCNSWYLDAEGIPATWPWTRDRFDQEMAAPDLNDFDLVG